ncbi:hypothetical protein Tco_1432663, partial [Tanacetum coccineum]
ELKSITSHALWLGTYLGGVNETIIENCPILDVIGQCDDGLFNMMAYVMLIFLPKLPSLASLKFIWFQARPAAGMFMLINARIRFSSHVLLIIKSSGVLILTAIFGNLISCNSCWGDLFRYQMRLGPDGVNTLIRIRKKKDNLGLKPSGDEHLANQVAGSSGASRPTE